MSAPLVSIVMPCYRCEGTVEGAVHSVQRQTLARWELIAVDDGSDDGTPAVLRALAAAEPRLRVLSLMNGGVSRARNAGLEQARGEWITFLDADDALPPDALERLVALADGETDAVCGACELVRGGKRERVVCAKGDRAALMESLVRGDSALNNMCGKLHRASVIAGIRLREDVKVGEDVLFNLEALAASRRWRVTDESVYDYVMREDSAIARARRDVYRSSLPMLRGIDAFLSEKGLETALFRAHIDAYLRVLRADRGRFRAAMAMCGDPARAVTRGVRAGVLPAKHRLYYLALRWAPILSFFLP